jgi:hypothetical protein
MLANNNRGIVTIRDVTRIAVALEQMNKHASTETNTSNNRRDVFSLPFVPRGYKNDKGNRLKVEFRSSSLVVIRIDKTPGVGRRQNN